MKIVFLIVLSLFSRLGSGQDILESYRTRTDSLNKVNFERFKTNGEFDTKNMKTGFWREYALLRDSVESVPATVQLGDTSINLDFPKPSELQKSEGYYESGLMNNQWKWFEAFYDNNDTLTWRIKKETGFIDGKKNGMEIQYGSFEAIFKKSSYVNDQLDGFEYIYPKRDVIGFKILYMKGVEQIITSYFENGNLKAIENYERPPITEITKYHENGQVQAKYTVKGGKIDGQALLYDEKGKLVEKKYFKNGVEGKRPVK
jgi:antitoxin component YwqK of YwqJK toxin-antitoxin module